MPRKTKGKKPEGKKEPPVLETPGPGLKPAEPGPTKGKKQEPPELPARTEETPEEKASRLETELAETQDQRLRLAAEFDNYQKRTARQFENIIKTANEELVLELISVIDTFELALAAAQSHEDYESFHQGVEMIFKQLMETLQKRGLKRIEALGQEFDPNFHEAIRQAEEKDQPSNTVVQEVQKGYMLGDRVIRAAKVVVNK
jgi:molecular chaperone GrpE